ncbi:MAG: L,D-transpeptidase [Polyangiaceae bacterium]|nr:L,D-transpeptidase [Polyangiaceae bacterium]MCK6536275.1 L,D-transpeptidase [Polyangiaceae bacterium]
MRRFALVVTTLASSAAAQPLPWIEGGLPVAARISSVEVPEKDEPLYVRAGPLAARRGSAEMGARLPLYAAKRGPGCQGYWLMVGPMAWVCQDRVRLSSEPPVEARKKPLSMPEGLPYRYHFVGRNGALGYRTLSVAEEVAPDAELEPGFSVAVLSVAKRGGDPFAFTTKNLWIPLRDLGPARALPLQGAELEGGRLNVAWVFEDHAAVYEKPGGTRLKSEVRPQWERLEVLDTVVKKGRRWFRIGDGRWVEEGDVRSPTAAPMPGEAAPGERWIDVDIGNQVVTAYEGERPVFATLVSTGKGKGKSILATPVGTHRIWVKLLSSDMDNLENEEASRYYAIQDVPWVMFFEKGYGLHGTFWHRSFGRVRSHGCVNLTPLDAQRLFNWTGPTLPAGWTAALPTPYDRGTLIRVR